MMTHGWRRFPTDNLFRPAPFAPKFFLEHGQFFSGQVNNMVGKGVKEATLTAFAVQGEGTNDKAFTTTTDSAGHFLFEGIDFQDTTVFMIPFYNKRGRIPYDIQFDKSYYRPRLSPTAPYKKQVQQVEQADEAVLQMYKKSSFGVLREYSMEAFTGRPAAASSVILLTSCRHHSLMSVSGPSFSQGSLGAQFSDNARGTVSLSVAEILAHVIGGGIGTSGDGQLNGMSCAVTAVKTLLYIVI